VAKKAAERKAEKKGEGKEREKGFSSAGRLVGEKKT